MKKLILILTLLLTIGVSGQSEMFGKDKLLHFEAGIFLGGISYELGKIDEGNKFLWSVVGATSVGLAKEMLDSSWLKNPQHFDVLDIVATSLGGLTAYVLSEYVGIPGYVVASAGIIGLGINLNLNK